MRSCSLAVFSESTKKVRVVKRSCGKPPSEPLGEDRAAGLHVDRRGLVLDDFLSAVEQQQFGLPRPNSAVDQSSPGVKKAGEAIISATINRHGSEIYSKSHSLLGELGGQIYSKWTRDEVYSGRRIRPDRIRQTLWKVLELGLQTIVLLPSRDPKPVYRDRRLKSLARVLDKSGEKLRVLLHEDEVRRRIESCKQSHASWSRLSQYAAETLCAADALDAVRRVNVAKSKLGSPNPQVRFAMYLIRWIEACTGGRHYDNLATLIQAAFHAAGKCSPRWIDRLGVEMHLQTKHRRKWIKSISS